MGHARLLHMQNVRVTTAVAHVLALFLTDLTEQRYGYDLMKVTGFPSGKLYPILARLEAAGWLEGESEGIDPHVEGRPPRRWYRLTEDGAATARQALTELRAVAGSWL